MLSRVAEHLYWLARYVERAEATARLAIAASDTILDLPDGVPYDWESLMQVFGSGDSGPGISEAEVMEQLVLSLEHPGSIRASIASARENARVTRDLIPKDAWIALNELHGLIERQSFAGFDRSTRVRLLKQVISNCRLWHGCLIASQARDLGSLFCVLVIVWNMPIWCPVWSIRASHRWFLVCPPAGAAMSPLGGKIYCQLSVVSSYTVTARAIECVVLMCWILCYGTTTFLSRWRQHSHE